MLARMWRKRNTPPLLMGLHPAAETDGDLDAIAVGDELLRVFELCVEITNVDARGHPDLLDLHHMLVLSGLFFPLALLKPKLSVVHQLAHRRSGLGRDLDQVQPLFVSNPQRLRGGHDAQLLPLGTDQADLPVIDGFIQFMHLLTNGRNTSVPKITKRGYQTGIRTTTNRLAAV